MKPPGRRALWGTLLFAAALAVRLFVAFRTALPSVDGVIFLSMAEDLARGEWTHVVGRVFHPFFPLLTAPLIALGVEPFAAARIVLSLAGAGASALVLPLALGLGASFQAALAVSLLSVFSVWPVRYVGDAYSEPLFTFLAAAALLLHLRGGKKGRERRGSLFAAGLLAGLAFTTRPEGAALAGILVLAGPARGAVLLGAALPTLAYLGGRYLLLGEMGPTPKLGFMLPMGPLGAPSVGAGILLYAQNLGRALLLGFEALGPLGWGLALAGAFLVLREGKARSGPAGRVVLPTLLVALAGMAAFQVKRRFLLDWEPFLLALGARALDRAGRRTRNLLFLLAALSVLWSLLRLAPSRKWEKTGEVVVARWIAGELRPGERIVTDMPRVAYYAGFRPPPPRVPTPEELARACASKEVRFLVLGAGRELLRRFGPPPPWRPAPLPPRVARAAKERGIALFIRPAR